MTNTVPESVRDALVSDLHGESLGTDTGVKCDFCGSLVDITSSVQYEALHLTDLDGVKNALGVPDMWLLDGVRCGDCEIEAIEPETDGIEEALLVVSVAEANGVYSVDTTDLEIVSFSPGDEGYYPPVVPLQAFLEQVDVGMARWHRIRELLEFGDEIVTTNPIKQILSNSLEIPPSIAAFDPDPNSDQAH